MEPETAGMAMLITQSRIEADSIPAWLLLNIPRKKTATAPLMPSSIKVEVGMMVVTR